jgi:ferrous iron transport protein B
VTPADGGEEAAQLPTVALVGNPNVGKSSLFNHLSGSRQQVANYPGVTVDAREGTLGEDYRLVDLPGTYSLRPSALDDAITADVLCGVRGDPPAVVVVVLDATQLRRSLYLFSEIADLALPTVVALNLVDEARRAGVNVPSEHLAESLGVPVVETVGSEGEGVSELREALAQASVPKRGWELSEAPLEERLAAGEGTRWQRLQQLVEAEPDLQEQESTSRYAWITELMAGHPTPSDRARTESIDRVLLHPVVGPLIFLVVMGLVFQSIFSWAEPLMKFLDEGVFQNLQGWANANLVGLLGETLTSLVSDGLIAGVGAVVVFLPQIVILFLLLGLLEDSGYMSRAAFLVDRPFRSVGLSGRAFIPLLSSFACAIPGIMAARTISSRRERWLTVLIAPLMTCSARLPVYVLLISAFVPNRTVLGPLKLQGLTLLGLYLAGLLAGVAVAIVVGFVKKARQRLLPLVVELPPYRRPTARATWLKLRTRAGDFLKRAGTVIFAVSLVLWVLLAFPRLTPQPGQDPAQVAAAQVEQSYAGRVGHAMEPVIKPLGYDWKIGVGLLGSFAAREVFVSTMGIVYSLGEEQDETSKGLYDALRNAKHPETGAPVYTLATVASLLVFFVFALQCGATVAVVRREMSSWRFALAQLFAFLAMAYVGALITYQGLRLAGL